MATSIILPEMGEGVIEGTLSRWLVNEGDRIEQFAPIAEVETDKVTTETTSETAGVILKLCVNEGQTIPVGTVLAYVGEPGETVGENGDIGGAITATAATTPPAIHEAPVEQEIAPRPENGGAMPVPAAYTGRISPVVGRMAAEHGIDLGRVTGTGRDGRVTKEDVLAYIEQLKRPPTAANRPRPLRRRTGEGPPTPAERAAQTRRLRRCGRRCGEPATTGRRRRTTAPDQHPPRHRRAHGAQQADQPPRDDGL